jgi:hypothetical protein
MPEYILFIIISIESLARSNWIKPTIIICHLSCVQYEIHRPFALTILASRTVDLRCNCREAHPQARRSSVASLANEDDCHG